MTTDSEHRPITLSFHEDGTVTTVSTPEAREFVSRSLGGTASKRRASYVEPCCPIRRLLFHAIRRCVADESGLAAWTRCWTCHWRINIIGGPTFGKYWWREIAIRAEVRWLNDNPEHQTK